MQNKKNLDMLIIPLKLLVICTVIALLVAGVNALTKDKIAALEQAKIAASLEAAFPDAVSFNKIPVPNENFENVTSFSSAVATDGATIGYAVLCEPKGFKDIIALTCAYEPDGTIKSVVVTKSSESMKKGETSGEAFLSQFKGLSGDIVVGTDIDAVSGATISSEAIASGVNEASALVNTVLNGGAN